MKSRNWLYPLILLAITFFIFSPTLFHNFVLTWDDAAYLLENPSVNSLNIENLGNIFTVAINRIYSPLTLVSFAVEHRFFGFNPWIFHLDNLLLHLAVTALIFLFAQKIGLTSRAAFFAALLFAIHPLRVESVAWVSERKDLLYAVFYMLALYRYVQYIGSNRVQHFHLSLIYGLLSMLAKPMAISLPLTLFTLDWLLKRNARWSRLILEKIFYCIYMIPLIWKTFSHWPLHEMRFHLKEGILIWVWSFVFYVEKFINPWVLVPYYELPQPMLFGHPSYKGAVCLFLIFLYSIFHFREHRFYVFGWIYYLASIFFVLRIYNVLDSGNLSPVADRYIYMAVLGFCLWAGSVFENLLQAKPVFRKMIGLGMIVLFLALAGKTYLQTKIWQNDLTLWSYTIQKTPESPLPYINRGLSYEKIQKYDLAVADYTTAVGINPHYYVSASDEKGDETNTLLANNPFYVVARRNRGKVYHVLGKNDLAVQDFNEVLRINPGDTEIQALRMEIRHNPGVQE